ncbi:unnamed protein product [Vitrella brassicaformis CCMP3155]|uniref:SET domain-containing protein n=1 Tax=Vitrella brassicaformis (strain CCMP3155) TaxID=1169540 RepID=A0A0G4EBQ3_VITBC|nr:unnamed protein product [Vitrella brassicaformis CCMP3155]|eukprot:CEL93070.1 unnamed protein product [Vitrella brassicaformis CCMP3155]
MVRGGWCVCRRRLVAARRWEPFEVLGEYTGYLVPPSRDGPYVCKLVQDEADWEAVSVDASKAGNELRFVNDYRGISEQPNVSFSSCFIDGLPRTLLVVTRPVAFGEEFLADYGQSYWAARGGGSKGGGADE